MKRFDDYALDIEFEAEWRQFAADLTRQAELEARQQETLRAVRLAVARCRRKQKLRQLIARIALVGVAISWGVALVTLLDGWLAEIWR
jgi:hypothetical protein